jgi:hypothetical protein
VTPLHQELRSHASWLFDELHFEVIKEEYDYKAFGDTVVLLRSQGMRMRFVLDRGQVFAQFEPPTEPGEWVDLSFLLHAINGRAPLPTFDLDGLLSLVRANFDVLIKTLGRDWGATKEILRRQGVERMQLLRAGTTAPKKNIRSEN